MHYADNITLFKYCGAWQKSDSYAHTMISYWNVAYVEVDFTGTSVTAEFANPSTFKASIDGGAEVLYSSKSFATFTATGDGPHTLRIAGYSKTSHIYFKDAYVPNGCTLSRTADKAHYIQFIGDSISEANGSFTRNSAPILGWDYSLTAQSRMALRTGKGYYDYNESVYGKKIGMEDAFFRTGCAPESGNQTETLAYQTYFNNESLKYNFDNGNKPDIVFIFLGTNDGLIKDSSGNIPEALTTDFTLHYSEFVNNVFNVYGDDTQVVLMQGLSEPGISCRFSCIRNAAEAIMAEHPDNVRFIDRDVIAPWNVEIDPSDKIHPTDNGYATLSVKIAEYLNNQFN